MQIRTLGFTNVMALLSRHLAWSSYSLIADPRLYARTCDDDDDSLQFTTQLNHHHQDISSSILLQIVVVSTSRVSRRSDRLRREMMLMLKDMSGVAQRI
mmetsp:Transcript_6186/g.9104  ORF Transcript_6186/g.9104 Transcript_6186/m.9104 type:complete len:99 (+) Transcript_6186:332-628(+)